MADALPVEQRGREYERQGDKTRTGFALFSNKHEDALELYKKALNSYKLAKQWREAGEVSKKAADCCLTLKQKYEAAQEYLESGNCFKKVSNSDAVASYQLAIDLFVDLGKFQQAARLFKDVAALYEADSALDAAIDAYRRAAEFFQGEESHALAADCLLKVALFAAQLENYQEAISIFEKLASDAVESPLRRFNARDYLLRAGVCYLCNKDNVGAREALQNYSAIDATFSTSREGRLLAALVEAFEAQDLEKYVLSIQEYDSLSKLDAWKTTMMLRVKKFMQADSEAGTFT